MVVNDTKNLPEDEKQKLAEYRKKYYKMGKDALLLLEKIFYFQESNDLEKIFWWKIDFNEILRCFKKSVWKNHFWRYKIKRKFTLKSCL